MIMPLRSQHKICQLPKDSTSSCILKRWMEVRGTRLGEVCPLSPDCHMNTRIGGPKHMVKTNPYQSLMSFQ